MFKRIVLILVLVLFSAAGAQAYKILLLGDSTVQTPYLPEKDQVHARLKVRLQAALPGTEFEIVNAGQGGESIGPGAKSNLIEADVDGLHFYSRYDQITRVNNNVDLVFIRYGLNDMNNYSPAEFKVKLKNLCECLKKDYPGVKIVVETSMYMDPNHTNNADPNNRGREVFETIRAFAKEEGCILNDVYEALKAATDAGNWDLRIRLDKVTVDDSKDAEHVKDGDMSWWSNVHPNAKGLDIIAEKEANIAVKLIKEKTGK